MELNDKAKKVFALKYSTRKSKSWKEACRSIADFMAEGERNYGSTNEDVEAVANAFFDSIFNLRLIPGGRIIANAATGIKNLANCIIGNTRIYTRDRGIVKMNEIREGDYVLTHKNRFRRVLKVWSNGNKRVNYYHKGRKNSLKCSIGATPEHLVLDYDDKWVQISSPIIGKLKEPRLFSDVEFPKKFILEYKDGVYEELEGKLVKLNLSVGKPSHGLAVGKYDKRFNEVFSDITNDKNLAYLFGLYLAEGGINSSRLYFTFNKNERGLIDSVSKTFIEYFNLQPIVQESSSGNWVQVSIYSQLVCNLFLNIFGSGCYNKRIPEWVFASPIDYAESLLKGVLDGDGHIKKDGRINLVLANPTLVYESTLLARYCGFSSNFCYESMNKLSKHPTSKSVINVSDCVNYIHKIGENFEEVFDMEVEEDHSFVAGDIICHNCFVLGIEDSRQSIYGTLKDAAEVFASGGGIGYTFSNIREEGAYINTTGGQASGPLSFMTLFDQTGEVISQASRR